jgi:hypothetical protein
MNSFAFGHWLFVSVDFYLPWKTNRRFEPASVVSFLKIVFPAHACVEPTFGLDQLSSVLPNFGRYGLASCRIVFIDLPWMRLSV